jgi:AraC-like DNA-binding protein
MTTSSTTPPLSESRPIYVERVNAVIDYIEAHLADDLTLGTLAEVAHFSPYHFHRVFSTMVGETLSRFISRLRVERAATLLVQHTDRAITDIAVDCGFTNPSSFARSFRESFGMSASEWRTRGFAAYERGTGGNHPRCDRESRVGRRGVRHHRRTDLAGRRVSACITVPPGTETSGDIGQMIVEGGRFAVGHFTLSDQDYGEAWYSLAGGWLPSSGYEPDDRHPYERYPFDESDTNPDKRRVDICLPVRPLRRY